MSIHVLSWVLRNSTTRLGNRLVLIVLADHAAEDGASAYPSVATIAREANLSRRAVQVALRDLESEGHIKAIGTSRFDTTEYQILRGRKVCAGEENDTNLEEDSSSASKDAPKPSFEPSFEPSIEKTSPSPATELDKDFDEFYRAFPLRRKPHEAKAKYRAARKSGATHAEIMAGIGPYIKDVERQREEGFPQLKWQAPASWLYQGRWKDEYDVPQTDTDERRRIEKARRMMSADQRAAAKSLAAYPYDNDSARIMGESKEVEDDSSTTPKATG